MRTSSDSRINSTSQHQVAIAEKKKILDRNCIGDMGKAGETHPVQQRHHHRRCAELRKQHPRH